MTHRVLEGWGRTPRSAATVVPLEAEGRIQEHGRGALARGLGRSYGDAALNSGGVIVDTTGRSTMTLDPTTGVLRGDPGASIGQVLELAVPHGWFPPVTPGTKHVTLGGAFAADIHGKNHHRDGCFSGHVRSIDLLTADGSVRNLKPSDDLFRATAGGLGLTGIITAIELQLIAVESARVVVDTLRLPDLDALMAEMVAGDDRYRYSVAWIDLLATGPSLGRGVLTRGDHAPSTDTSDADHRARSLPDVPDVVPNGLLNGLTVRAFNEVWYRKAPRRREGEVQGFNRFFYPLDVVGRWNRLYGRRGFVQYQIALPDESTETLAAIVGEFAALSLPSFLAVLKRLGPGTGLLSFPIEGWTLAVDIPVGDPELGPALDRFDRRVADAGGRVYLAKDSRMRPDLLDVMYPEIDEWRRIQAEHDPGGQWRSDLDRRLRLTGGRSRA